VSGESCELLLPCGELKSQTSDATDCPASSSSSNMDIKLLVSGRLLGTVELLSDGSFVSRLGLRHRIKTG
jgi:hypothetical protein